jgi:hypothetical protein
MRQSYAKQRWDLQALKFGMRNQVNGQDRPFVWQTRRRHQELVPLLLTILQPKFANDPNTIHSYSGIVSRRHLQPHIQIIQALCQRNCFAITTLLQSIASTASGTTKLSVRYAGVIMRPGNYVPTNVS